ncbi:MAG TPA: hypothetical protein VE571_07000 [Solirubrobacteraceae bacterium]|nr:hypothetical protein [Solirubrobacteraceae bacterium]
MGAIVSLDLPVGFLDTPGQRAGFVALAAFLASFLFIRTSARLMRSPRVPWWPGSVTAGGVHLHHLVWGIVLILLNGFLGFAVNPVSPWDDVLAALFGIGAGLTLDEFALWVHLEDVYWTEEGRESFDAVVIAAVLGGLIVMGVAPFDVSGNTSSLTTLFIAVAINVLLAMAAILKGKPLLGLIGIFIPVASLIGAIRLASPGSWWARRVYRSGPKLERSQRRWSRIEARRRRIGDLIAGTPSDELGAGASASAPAPGSQPNDGPH